MKNFGTRIKIDWFNRNNIKLGKASEERLWGSIDCNYCAFVWKDTLLGSTTEGDGFNIYLDGQLDAEFRFDSEGVLTNINDLFSPSSAAVYSDHEMLYLGQEIPANTWGATYNSPNDPLPNTEYEVKVTSVVDGSEVTAITKNITSEAFEDCGDPSSLNCDLGTWRRSASGPSGLITLMRPGCQFSHESYLDNDGSIYMAGHAENSKITTAGTLSHQISAYYRDGSGDFSYPNNPVIIQDPDAPLAPVSCDLYIRDVVAEIPVRVEDGGEVYTLYEVRFSFGSYSFSQCFGGSKNEEALFIRSVPL